MPLRLLVLLGSCHLARTAKPACPAPRTFWHTSSAMASSSSLHSNLSEWSFSEPKLAALPLDRETSSKGSRQVPRAVFSLCRPTPLQEARKLVVVNDDAMKDLLDLDPSAADHPDFADFVSGNKVLEGSMPMAHRYGGHQFGSWVRGQSAVTSRQPLINAHCRRVNLATVGPTCWANTSIKRARGGSCS